jgi:hypothetical protein
VRRQWARVAGLHVGPGLSRLLRICRACENREQSTLLSPAVLGHIAADLLFVECAVHQKAIERRRAGDHDIGRFSSPARFQIHYDLLKRLAL